MDYQVKVCKFPTVFIVTAFIMLHPKISIIMVESNLRPQMDPSMMTTWSSSNNGPPVYGQMFDEKARNKICFFFSMMICAMKISFHNDLRS